MALLSIILRRTCHPCIPSIQYFTMSAGIYKGFMEGKYARCMARGASIQGVKRTWCPQYSRLYLIRRYCDRSVLHQYQALKTCAYIKEPWVCHSEPHLHHFIPHRHYHLSLDVIGCTLTNFRTYEMVSVVHDAIKGELLTFHS